jgi:hypothetical protein
VLVLVGAAVVFMRKGRSWARVVLTIVGVLGILANAASLFGAGLLLTAGALGVVIVIAAAVQILLALGAIVFMYRGAAKPYFAGAR